MGIWISWYSKFNGPLLVQRYRSHEVLDDAEMHKVHELMTFYSFSAKHWSSIRATNPIESSLATIRHRTKRIKGYLSLGGMLSMMFKLERCAEKKWNRLRGLGYLAKVIQGLPFKDEIEQTTNRSNQTEAA